MINFWGNICSHLIYWKCWIRMTPGYLVQHPSAGFIGNWTEMNCLTKAMSRNPFLSTWCAEWRLPSNAYLLQIEMNPCLNLRSKTWMVGRSFGVKLSQVFIWLVSKIKKQCPCYSDCYPPPWLSLNQCCCLIKLLILELTHKQGFFHPSMLCTFLEKLNML